MHDYWKQLKAHLELGIAQTANDLNLNDNVAQVESADDHINISLIHNGEAVVRSIVTRGERTIDLHIVLADGKEITGSYNMRDGYLASVNSDSIYFADAAHAAGNFLKPVTDALYDPPFNIPKR